MDIVTTTKLNIRNGMGSDAEIVIKNLEKKSGNCVKYKSHMEVLKQIPYFKFLYKNFSDNNNFEFVLPDSIFDDLQTFKILLDYVYQIKTTISAKQFMKLCTYFKYLQLSPPTFSDFFRLDSEFWGRKFCPGDATCGNACYIYQDKERFCRGFVGFETVKKDFNDKFTLLLKDLGLKHNYTLKLTDAPYSHMVTNKENECTIRITHNAAEQYAQITFNLNKCYHSKYERTINFAEETCVFASQNMHLFNSSVSPDYSSLCNISKFLDSSKDLFNFLKVSKGMYKNKELFVKNRKYKTIAKTKEQLKTATSEKVIVDYETDNICIDGPTNVVILKSIDKLTINSKTISAIEFKGEIKDNFELNIDNCQNLKRIICFGGNISVPETKNIIISKMFNPEEKNKSKITTIKVKNTVTELDLLGYNNLRYVLIEQGQNVVNIRNLKHDYIKIVMFGEQATEKFKIVIDKSNCLKILSVIVDSKCNCEKIKISAEVNNIGHIDVSNNDKSKVYVCVDESDVNWWGNRVTKKGKNVYQCFTSEVSYVRK